MQARRLRYKIPGWDHAGPRGHPPVSLVFVGLSIVARFTLPSVLRYTLRQRAQT